MSESDDGDETNRLNGSTQADGPPTATVDVYQEESDVAGVVRVGDATLVLGYAARLADRLACGAVAPTHYADVAPAAPESYLAAIHAAGAQVHDVVDLRERADGLYADGVSLAAGVGVVPCNPSYTVLVRLHDRDTPVDLLFSNAPAEEVVASESLSGALPVYGTVGGVETGRAPEDGDDLGDEQVSGRHPDGPATVVAVGERAAAVLVETEGVVSDVSVTARDGLRVVVDGDGTVTTQTDDDRRENGSTGG